jgi:hypothetical protein
MKYPIYNSQLIEVPLGPTGATAGQQINFPIINRLKDVVLLGFACYDTNILSNTPSGYVNLATLSNTVVNIQDKTGQSPIQNFPSNGANPLVNFGFSQDVNPIMFDVSKSSVRFTNNNTYVVGQPVQAFLINVFFLHLEQYRKLRKEGFFKEAVGVM